MSSNAQIDNAVAAIMGARYQPKVGDRVRVTGAIGECQFAYESGITHFPETIGAAGEVVESPCNCGEDHGPDHVYAVFFDPRPRWMEEGGIYHSVVVHCFAATELELLPPVPPAHGGGEGN